MPGHSYKDLTFPSPKDANIQIKLSDSGKFATVTADRPVKGLVIEAEHDLAYSDNCLDLMPGDPQTVLIDNASPEARLTFRRASFGLNLFHITNTEKAWATTTPDYKL